MNLFELGLSIQPWTLQCGQFGRESVSNLEINWQGIFSLIQDEAN